MKNIFVGVILLLTISTSQAQSKVEVIEGAFHFYVLGDWGRNGQHAQQEVANAMGRMALIIEPEFIISTGDNFYPNGVASVDDPFLLSSFENVYTAAELFVPWHVVLGNHDYRGNVEAEIAYTHVSQRWNMPASYFGLKVEEENFTAQFIFTDTSPYEESYYERGSKYRQKMILQDTLKQNRWMDSVFASSEKADWLFVVGHHPAYSGGKRDGKTSSIARHFDPYFKKSKVDAYFAGHEHDLQVIKQPWNTLYFISGAGSETRPTGKLPESVFAASEHGYMIVSITQDRMLVQLMNEKDELLYSQDVRK